MRILQRSVRTFGTVSKTDDTPSESEVSDSEGRPIALELAEGGSFPKPPPKQKKRGRACCTRQVCGCCCALAVLLGVPLLVVWIGFVHPILHKMQASFCGLNITAETTTWIEWEFRLGMLNPTISDITIPHLQIATVADRRPIEYVPLELEGGARRSVDYGALISCELKDVVLKAGRTSSMRLRCALSQYPSGRRALARAVERLLDGGEPMDFSLRYHTRVGFFGLGPYTWDGGRHFAIDPNATRDDGPQMPQIRTSAWWAWPHPPTARDVFTETHCGSGGAASFDASSLLSGQSIGFPTNLGQFVRLMHACPRPLASFEEGAVPSVRYAMHLFNPIGLAASVSRLHIVLSLAPAEVVWAGNRTAAAGAPGAIAACSILGTPWDLAGAAWARFDVECALGPALGLTTSRYFAATSTTLNLNWALGAGAFGVSVSRQESLLFDFSLDEMRNAPADYMPTPNVPRQAASDCAAASIGAPGASAVSSQANATLAAMQRVMDELLIARMP